MPTHNSLSEMVLSQCQFYSTEIFKTASHIRYHLKAYSESNSEMLNILLQGITNILRITFWVVSEHITSQQVPKASFKNMLQNNMFVSSF